MSKTGALLWSSLFGWPQLLESSSVNGGGACFEGLGFWALILGMHVFRWIPMARKCKAHFAGARCGASRVGKM